MFRALVPRLTAICAVAVLIGANVASAGGPVFWEISRQEDIEKGDAVGVSISDGGSIRLAPGYPLVFDTREAYIWSSTSDSTGNIYLGTGHEGRIFKVTPSGEGSLLFDAPELDVTALTTDSRGMLYAGTSPDGKIYRITPDGEASEFYNPEEKYIWSLVYEDSTSTLFAGTGQKGVVHQIDGAGNGKVLVDTTETNIVSLVLDRSGHLIAGTDPSGIVLRISRDGSMFALLDTPMQEIHKLDFAPDGSILALGINPQPGQRQAGAGVSSTSSLSTGGSITISVENDDQSSGLQSEGFSSATTRSRSRRSAEGARSAVFRILPDGGSEVRWRSSDSVAFALKSQPDGSFLVGTGSKGRIYSVSAGRSQVLLIQSPEDQTSTILRVGDALYATSSNLGRLYRIDSRPVAEGVYTSPVHDTRFAGQWGVITWRAGGGIELRTRSGNTETPDSTWSEWSAAYTNARGDQITSPSARFIQWRATLIASSPSASSRGRGASPPPATDGQATQLQSVVLAYLPRNQAPEITSLNVLAPGVALQEMPIQVDPSIISSGLDPQIFGVVANVPPRRFYQKGARTLTWQASDPNNDSLNYDLFYRSLGDSEWTPLAANITQTYFTIDGNRLPDGTYFFRVVAGDSPSNPPPLALTDEATTDAIEIDNTPPAVTVSTPVIKDRSVEVVFDAVDETSRVIRGEYSVNGGPWRLVFPVDGVADSAREMFKVNVRFDRPGEHIIAFRCTDSSSNVGTGKVTVSVR